MLASPLVTAAVLFAAWLPTVHEVRMLKLMKPLQVYLDDTDARALTAWAGRRGWTKSQAVRVAIRAIVRAEKREDPLLAASGMIDGLPADVSERFDAYLEETYVATPTRTRARRTGLRR